MSELLCAINSLAVFGQLRETSPLKELAAFLKLSDSVGTTQDELIAGYSRFVMSLYSMSPEADLSSAMWQALKKVPNAYLDQTSRIELAKLRREKEPAMPKLLELAASRELEIITDIGNLSYIDLENLLYYDEYIPQFKTTGIDIKQRYMDMLSSLGKKGYGKYAEHMSFRVNAGAIEPVMHPDPVKLDDLIDYELPREAAVSNTRSFVEGKTASDVLFYGDAGTGKSSTVKACANQFAGEGVRLVEVPKSELVDLADIIEELSGIPLKFIIFIDDVSFDSGDERIGPLKSVLEGAASGDRRNILIYATSNRRHMIKETYDDRISEVHRSDTLAEQMSLSERFGLRIRFDRPNKQMYLNIARGLAHLRGSSLSDEEIDAAAEAYAIRKGGRSARVARQFAEQLGE